MAKLLLILILIFELIVSMFFFYRLSTKRDKNTKYFIINIMLVMIMIFLASVN